MPKFRSIPKIVEAKQWNPVNDSYGAGYLAMWLKCHGVEFIVRDGKKLHFNTLQGLVVANPTDWVIKDASDFYVCSAATFETTYELAQSTN